LKNQATIHFKAIYGFAYDFVPHIHTFWSMSAGTYHQIHIAIDLH